MKSQQSGGRVRRTKARGDQRKTWLADFVREDGKRVRRVFGTKAEAEGWLRHEVALRERVKVGEARRDQDLTLDQVLDEHVLRLRARGSSAPHVSQAQWSYALFKEAVGGHRLARDIGPADLDAFVASLRPTCSARTRQRHVTMVRAAFRHAKFARRLALDPTDGYCTPVPRPADRKKRRRDMTDAEIERFLRASTELDSTAKIPQRPLWEFLMTTGARWSESVRLRWADVTDDGLIVFRAETRKAGRDREPFPSPPSLRALLQALRRSQGQALGKVPKATDYVFLRVNGTPWATAPNGSDRCLRHFYRTLARAGIPRKDDGGRSLDIHSLRGLVAGRLQRNGVPEGIIARLLGATAGVIRANYVRPSADDLRAAVEGLPTISAGIRCPLEADTGGPARPVEAT